MPKHDRHGGIFWHILDLLGQFVGAADRARPALHGQPYGPAHLAIDQGLARELLRHLELAIARRERLGFAFVYPPDYNSPLDDPGRWERGARQALERIREEARALFRCVLEHPPFPAAGDAAARGRYLQADEQFYRLARRLRGKRVGRLLELDRQLRQRPQTPATPPPPPKQRSGGASSRTRRRRPNRREVTRLTDKEVEAVHLVGEHKGNVAAAARAAGKSRQTMDRLYRKALKKMGKSRPGKPRTIRLPEDRRGQPVVDDRPGE